MNIQNIDINLIDQHPENPRKDLGDLTELASSIKESGIHQNLTVVKKRQAFRALHLHHRTPPFGGGKACRIDRSTVPCRGHGLQNAILRTLIQK